MEKIKVLYIDDEVSNLNAFKASFRRQFDVYTATSADEGYDILKSDPIEVVISDQRMPGKTGTDFFESIDKLSNIDLYRRGAIAGNTKSQTSLGYFYLFGDGIEKDYGKARMWLSKASEQGDADAFFFLGQIYH